MAPVVFTRSALIVKFSPKRRTQSDDCHSIFALSRSSFWSLARPVLPLREAVHVTSGCVPYMCLILRHLYCFLASPTTVAPVAVPMNRNPLPSEPTTTFAGPEPADGEKKLKVMDPVQSEFTV